MSEPYKLGVAAMIFFGFMMVVVVIYDTVLKSDKQRCIEHQTQFDPNKDISICYGLPPKAVDAGQPDADIPDAQ